MGDSNIKGPGEKGFEIPEMRDEQEIHLALGYLLKESKSAGMPMVSHLIGAAIEAIDLYDPQVKYQVNIYNQKQGRVLLEEEEFENLVDFVTDDEKVGNC